MKKAYFLNSNLKETRTGIEEAAMKRTFYFKKHLRVQPVFVTVRYNTRLKEIFEALKDQEKVESSTQLLNMYDYYQNDTDGLNTEEYYAASRSLRVEEVLNSNDRKFFNEEEKIVIYNKRNEFNRTIFNNYFSYNPDKIMHRRDYYDTTTGHLSKTQHLANGQTKFEVYYRKSGTACIYKTFREKNGKNTLDLIELLDDYSNVRATFKSEEEFITYWYQEYFGKISPEEDTYILVDRAVLFSEAVASLRKENLKTIFLMHSSHIVAGAPPETGAINRNYAHLLENSYIADAIVIFTERQKKHIQQRLGNWDHLKVIPHNLANLPKRINFTSRNSYELVYLARFSILKNQESLINAFKIVLEEFPEAKLHLYGEGDTKKRDQKYILENKLEESIFIHPFTSYPEEVYNQASLAVFPSKLEGFSLFVLESLSHGLPVVSYNIDYGPSDMIDEGINGLLIPPLNEEKLAEGILKILRDPTLHEQMSDAAYESAKRFKAGSVSMLWKDLLEGL